MKVTRVLHISHGVGVQLDAATAFYVNVLGLPVLDRPDAIAVPGLWLSTGGPQVHLNGRVAGTDPGYGPRPDHICLGVEDLNGAVTELRSAGVHVVEAGSLAERQVWLRDPAGHTIELQQDRP